MRRLAPMSTPRVGSSSTIQRGRSSGPLAEQRLLLVAAGEVGERRRRGRAATMCSWSITERTAERFGTDAHGTVAAERRRRGSVSSRGRSGSCTRPSARRSSGSIATPRRIARCGRSRGSDDAVEQQLARVGRVGPGDHAAPARCARCRRARRARRSRRRAPRGRRPRARCPHSARASSTTGASAGDRRGGREVDLELAAEHAEHQRVLGLRGRRRGARDPAVAHDRHACRRRRAPRRGSG